MANPSETGVPQNASPSPPTGELLGRDSEFERLDRTTRAGHWVEIVGTPGVGKSALAHQFVRRRREAGERWLEYDFQPAPDPDAALSGLAEDCEVDTSAISATSRLAERIGSRLESRGIDGIVLDNADVLSTRPELPRLLSESAFGVAWISTARTDVSSETERTVLQLGPLSKRPAAELYLRTARRHWLGSGSPEISHDQAAQLVERLDCHPIAIEFAAARINSLPPGAIRRRLDEGTDAASDSILEQIPAFRELLDRAWDDLEAGQRRVLQFLALFARPVPFELLDAARTSDAAPELADRHLDALARSGWIRPAGGDTHSREFRLSAPLKSFAGSRTSSTPEDAPGLEDHRAAVTGYAETLEREIRSGTDWSTAERLGALAPELLVAFDRFAEADPERAARALLPLRWLARVGLVEPPLRRRLHSALRSEFLEDCPPSTRLLLEAFGGEVRHRGQTPEDATDRLLDAHRRLPEQVDPSVRAEVAVASCLALETLDPDATRRRLDEAKRAAARVEEPVLRARAAERSGLLALGQFELDRAREQLAEARELLASVGDELFVPSILTGLGYVAHRLDLGESARNSLRESVRLYHRSDRGAEAAAAHFNLGAVLLNRTTSDEARSELARAAKRLDRTGTPSQRAAARIRLALAEYESGDVERARTHLRDALSTAQQSNDRHNQALAEATLAALRDDGASGHHFDTPLEDLDFAADPAAAAAFLAFASVCFALDEQFNRALEQYREIEDLAALLSESDRYLARTVERIEGQCRRQLRRLSPDPPDDLGGAPSARQEPRDNAWARLFGRLLDEAEADRREGASRIIPAQEDQSHHLRIHKYGHWFIADDGNPVDLTSREPLRRILSELTDVTQHPDREGATVDQLIETGWPEASPTRSSGANRVYYSIRKLREMGLEEILVTGEEGYHFAPTTKVRISGKPYDALEPT